jgi:hypothetical protein
MFAQSHREIGFGFTLKENFEFEDERYHFTVEQPFYQAVLE